MNRQHHLVNVSSLHTSSTQSRPQTHPRGCRMRDGEGRRRAQQCRQASISDYIHVLNSQVVACPKPPSRHPSSSFIVIRHFSSKTSSSISSSSRQWRGGRRRRFTNGCRSEPLMTLMGLSHTDSRRTSTSMSSTSCLTTPKELEGTAAKNTNMAAGVRLRRV